MCISWVGIFIDSVLIFLFHLFLDVLLCFACPFHKIALHAFYTIDVPDQGPKEVPISPPIHIPEHTSSISIISPSFDDLERKFGSSKTLRNYSFGNVAAINHRPCLTPISGSFDQSDSLMDISERIEHELNLNKPHLLYDYIADKTRTSKYRSSSITSTNELPLTELNLELFTSENENKYLFSESRASSTNELPLSDIKFRHGDTASCGNIDSERLILPNKSFSDPNLLDLDEKTPMNRDEHEHSSSYFPPIDAPRFAHIHEPLAHSMYHITSYSQPYRLSPMEIPLYPYSFYPTDYNTQKHLLNAPPSRSASQPAQLSINANTLITPSPTHPMRSMSNPYDMTPHKSPLKRAPSPPIVMTQTPVNPEVSCGVKRHRHSIAGQMSYIKMLGFGFGGPIGLKKMTGGSSNSLFSTAVISGSSSAPNLRDMIPSTASATGKLNKFYHIFFKIGRAHV